MFALLSPRVWILIGVGVALVAAFFGGMRVESNARDAALLKQTQKHDAEVQAMLAKQRDLEVNQVKQLDELRNKNDELTQQLQARMKNDTTGNFIKAQVRCPAPRPAQVVLAAPQGSGSAVSPSSPPVGGAATPTLAAESVLDTSTPDTSTTVAISLADRIFFSDFVGVYNAAVTREPGRLSQAASTPDGGNPPAGAASGRDILDNVDQNGKRFAECREKLKQWQDWARESGLAK